MLVERMAREARSGGMAAVVIEYLGGKLDVAVDQW